jgi:hypothetical protein
MELGLDGHRLRQAGSRPDSLQRHARSVLELQSENHARARREEEALLGRYQRLRDLVERLVAEELVDVPLMPRRERRRQLHSPTMSSGRTGTRGSSRPVASRSAATIAAVETTVGGSPTPLSP